MLIGIIPIAGVTTALITIYSIGSYFLADPYVGLIFLTSVVASCASADSYTSILTGIPGASTTAACVIDGYPMTQKGEAGRAMGIAIFDSTLNGLLYALLAFGLLPYYKVVILYFGTPEFAGFMIMSLACVGFVASKSLSKSAIAIIVGIWLGLIGLNPANGIARMTFDWEYLEDGIQMIPILSGLFGIPELLWGFKHRMAKPPQIVNYWQQLLIGFKDCIIYYKDMLRGGLIGFLTGLLPGVGGAVGDFLAYGATTASHKNQKFGNGNPLGLLGCEGANNSQKVSSMIPTVLFGVPAAPFAAMVMAICMYFGMELGTPGLLDDDKFVFSIGFGYVMGTLLVGLLSILFMKYIIKILEIPYIIYATLIIGIIVYANIQYTGGWEDYAILGLCSVIGITLKYFEISRPAVLVTYVIAERLEGYIYQTSMLYEWTDLLVRPIFMLTLIIAFVIIITSARQKDRGISYA